jgi:hypothetical protein
MQFKRGFLYQENWPPWYNWNIVSVIDFEIEYKNVDSFTVFEQSKICDER